MTYFQIQQLYFEGRESEVKTYFSQLQATGKMWVHRDIAFTHIHELILDFKKRMGCRYKHNNELQKKVGIIRQQVKENGCGLDSLLGILAKSNYFATLKIKCNGDYYLLDNKYSQPKQ